MHCGDNGILRGAETAVDKYQNRAEQEQNNIEDYENKIEQYMIATRTTSNGGGKLLWKNPNYTEKFLPQTITLNDSLTNYQYIKILFMATDLSISDREVDLASYSMDTLIINNKVNSQIYFSCYATGWSGHPLYYRFFYGEGNNITFKNGYSSGSGSNNAINDEICIPYYIIGYSL